MVEIKPEDERIMFSKPMSRQIHSCPAWKRVTLILLLLLGTAGSVIAQADGTADPSPYGKIVREIRIQGLRNTKESVVRKQLASQVGRLYTEETASDDRRYLDKINVFSSIQIDPSVVQGEVVLTVSVQELWPILAYPSANITSENGFSYGFGATMPSLLGRAISFSGSARFGGLTETNLSMQAPWRLRKREWFGVKYSYRDRNNKLDSFRENAHELEVKIGVKLRQNWRLSGRFGFMSMGSDVPGITLSSNNRDATPALGAVLEYDGRDLRSNPHKGWQTIFDVSQNGGFLGGDGNFVTTQFDIRRYQPLAARHILAAFSFLTLQSGIVGTDVPIYRDYHIGGTNTVRGWEIDGRQGNNQFITTLEYRFELLPPRSFRVYKYGIYAGMQLVAFGDLGTAWYQGSDFTRNMIGGGGFGVHLLVPFVERIRIEFGFGQSGKGMITHLGIREKADYVRERVR